MVAPVAPEESIHDNSALEAPGVPSPAACPRTERLLINQPNPKVDLWVAFGTPPALLRRWANPRFRSKDYTTL